MSRKAMLGHKIRRLRRDQGITQAAMAERLGISASYLNLIEGNQRPVTVALLLKIGQLWDVDIASFADDDGSRLLGALQEVFGDPLLAGGDVKRQDMIDLAEQVPTAASALVQLYRAYRDLADADRLEAERAAIGGEVGARIGPANPADEAGAFFHEAGNHFPELEAAAEEVWSAGGLDIGGIQQGLIDHLDRELTLRVRILPVDVMGLVQRRYDRHGRRVLLSEMLPPESRTFQLALQIALIAHRGLLDRLAGAAELTSEEARALVRVGLANYLAGAIVMPYDRIWRAATAVRYDIAVLGARFQASFEQVCHRLTTLQRPGARGVPFFMVRIDKAGNVSKRFSAAGSPLARFGGACPRWNVHDAFRAPGRIQVQVSEMPDGQRYFSLATTVAKPGAGHRQPGQTYALALGCDLQHAAQLVYADGMDVLADEAAVPIGLHCRICERPGCPQRAFPPTGHALVVDDYERGPTPYGFREA
ncbi:MAG: short-chain fatty acyl-CoA regulator family protein [Azospirillaceae bacterium]